MPSTPTSLDELFEEEAAKNRAKAEADDANPVLQAKIAARRKAEEEKIEREIAEGLRDEDGELLHGDLEGDLDEEEEDLDADD